MAPIITVHTAKTASQLARDHAGDIGIIHSAMELCMLVAPHSRSSHPPSTTVQTPAAVQENARTYSPDGVVTLKSFSLDKRREQRTRFARRYRMRSHGR